MSNLTAKQLKAIDGLLSHPTITLAAEHAGVARRTVYEWLKQDEFILALEAAQSKLVSSHVAKLSSVLSSAADVYIELLDSNDDSIRLRAADSVHKAWDSVYARRLAIKELEELEARIDDLEERYAEAN